MSSYRRARRIAARIALSVAGLIALTAGSVYAVSEASFRSRYEVPEHELVVATDSATIERGRHLATTRGCADCHSSDLGGKMIIDDAAVGQLGSANLTSGRSGPPLSNRDWELAVRHGLRANSTPLAIMPSAEFAGMSDEDLAAIIAYARSLPPSTTPKLALKLGPVLRALSAVKQVKLAAEIIPHDAAHPKSVVVEPTANYGKYLAAGCTGCHGEGLSGGKIPGAPPDWKPAANITPSGIGHYSPADFTTLLRTGVRPDGSSVDPVMPWTMTKHMTDIEIEAVFKYLRTVPARTYGTR